MNYQIASDSRGRLRIRYGAYRFGREYEEAVMNYFRRLPGVQSAEANCCTGSVLIYYDEQQRAELLTAADSLEFSCLTPSARSATASVFGFDRMWLLVGVNVLRLGLLLARI